MASPHKFNGERLREAREARGFTILQLSESIGVTKQAVSLYENAKSGLTDETLGKIMTALNMPRQYFYKPTTPSLTSPIFYRSMATTTKRMRDRAERRLDWFREIVRYVCEFVDLPKVDLPQLDMPADPEKIGKNQVEEAATQTRRHWGLGDGPISNIVLLLENKGVPVTRFDLGADKLDAFSVWDDYTGRPLTTLGTDKASAFRSRFDAAHELGHLVLHRNVPRSLVNRGEVFKLIEDQAHRFARAFLLPGKTFGAEFLLPNLESLMSQKIKWKASIASLVMRAEELGLFTAEQAKKIRIKRSREGWRTREPGDDKLDPEMPVLIAKSIGLIIDSGTSSAQELLSGFGLHAGDAEILAGLPIGQLEPQNCDTIHDPAPRLLPFPGLQNRTGSVS